MSKLHFLTKFCPFIAFLAALLLAGCGSYDTYSVDKPGTDGKEIKAYTWDDMKGFCFSCHNQKAPKIPLKEAGFLASPKVRARISNGSMPPSPGGFDKARALAYLDGKGIE